MSARSDIDEDADRTLKETIERHQLAVFLVGTVALGSLATALLAGTATHPLILPLVALTISFIPAALAVLLVRLGRDSDERVALRHRLTVWRVGLRWYILAVTVVPAAHLAGVAPSVILGATGQPSTGLPLDRTRTDWGLHSGRHCVVGGDECRDDVVVQPHRRQRCPDGSPACDVRRGVHRSRPPDRDDGAAAGVRVERSSALPDSRGASARRRTTAW